MSNYLEKALIFSKKLKNTTSRLDKIQILNKYKDDEEAKSFLKFLLDTFIVTGVSTKKLKKKLDLEPTMVFNDLNEVFDYLKIFNTGRDEDIKNLQHYIEQQDPEYSDFLIEVFSKKLKLGITAKTVNEVYGKNYVPTFAVQLAEPYSKKSDKINGLFFVTLKLDGNRIVAIKENNVVKFYTRKGKLIEGLVELEKEFESLPNEFVYDGELLLENPEGLPSGELFTKTQQVVRKDGEKVGLEFHVFDLVPLEEFKYGESNNDYLSRRTMLEMFFKSEFFKGEKTKLLPVLAQDVDKDIIPKILDDVLKQGYEGIMINNASGKYVTKRTVDLQKCKAEYDVDLLVTDVVIAIDGQFKGQVARLNVEYMGNTVGVGSGLTADLRKKWAENPEDIIGKVIQVQYTEKSKDENGKPSLRFPRFKMVREDKTAEDVNFE